MNADCGTQSFGAGSAVLVADPLVETDFGQTALASVKVLVVCKDFVFGFFKINCLGFFCVF